MPTLNWIGKEQIINHHNDVPFRVLERKYTFGKIRNEKLGIRNVDDCGDQISNSSFQISNSKIIHGDNLEALKALLPEYEGRIKCIYIDPPYNTGNENWVYNDNVNSPKIRKWLGQVVGKESEDLSRHDKWLCMMYPRLVLLQKLLSDDGAIFISIDDNEQANLKLICDEIFGANNFVMSITWRRSDNQANIGKIAKVAEYVLIYTKNINQCVLGRLPLSDKAKAEYQYEDTKGKYGRGQLRDAVRGKHEYDIITPNGFVCKGPWFISKEEFDKLVEQDLIHWPEKDGGTPRKKIYLSDMLDKGQIPNNFWGIEFGTNQRAANQLEKIFGKRVFDFPKPTTLIESILSIGTTDKNSIILDSFAGSGTTAHAVLNLNKSDGGNRKFILVEMEDYAETITAERVKRVIDGYGDTEGTGGSFDFYELGEPVFDADGNLNENIGTEKIREYIWYSEIRNEKFGIRNEDDCDSQISNSSFQISNSQYFLGKYLGTAYYFYYEKDQITTLDKAFLNTITHRAEQYVIYADNCLLSTEFMLANHIIFKKIPRDIKKL